MTIAEAEHAAGRAMVIVDFEQFGGHCYFAHPEGMKDDVILTVLSPDERPVTNPKDGVVGSATFEPVTSSPATTDAGIGIGASADAVRRVYQDSNITESKHHYAEGGLYLDVAAPEGDGLLRFEIGPEGAVFAIHGGDPDAVTLPEGCA
jgi:hypothetical protein